MPPISPFMKLEKHLKTIGEYYKFCGIFTPQRTLPEIFSEIWNRKDLNELLGLPDLNKKINLKGKYESEKFRKEGNRLYTERKFDKSLIAYNLAVISAPHPKTKKVKKDDDSFEALAFAYANRSALLYEMGMYSECLKDIDRAIRSGYPSNKLYKLEERKGKCYLRMNKIEQAEAKFAKILHKIKTSDPKNESAIENLKELLEQCSITENKRKDNFSLWYRHIFHRGPEFPIFLKKSNENEANNFCSSAIRIQMTSSKGRHLVATRDIEPGEVLLVERAFCSIVKLNEKIRNYCCVCLRKAPIVLPCDTCSLVVFCSEMCRSSPHNHHPLECSLLPILFDINPDEELGLVFRTLLRFTFEEILSATLEESEYSKTNEVKSQEFKSILKFQYNYSFFRELEGNLDKRSGESFLEAVANAIMGVKLLQKVPSFWAKKSGGSFDQEQCDLISLGGEMTRLLLNFQCNIHCVKELLIDPAQNILSAGSYDSGFGVYCAFSMMNHSCFPNAIHSSFGDTKFMYAINFIPKGEEILDSYGERFVSHDLQKRRNSIKEVYHFTCDCIACQEDWPMFAKLPKTFNMMCRNCKIALNGSLACDKCKKTFVVPKSKEVKESSKTSDVYDARFMEEIITKAWRGYEESLAEINKYRVSFANVKKIGKYISLLSKYTKLPHAPFVEAQEALLRCFDLMGSYAYTKTFVNHVNRGC